MIRAYIKNQASCPRVLHNRLWRFPFKPPALQGVIGLAAGRDRADVAAYSCGLLASPRVAGGCTAFG
jgi:hypothetical protein